MFDMSPLLRFCSLSCFSFSGVMIKFSFWFFVMCGLVCMIVWVYISFISNLIYRYVVVQVYSLFLLASLL
jgi:uncharacterized membrane protein YhaH (DUF805 family)